MKSGENSSSQLEKTGEKVEKMEKTVKIATGEIFCFLEKIRVKTGENYISDTQETHERTLYKSSTEQLHLRAVEERIKHNLSGYYNALMPREY